MQTYTSEVLLRVVAGGVLALWMTPANSQIPVVDAEQLPMEIAAGMRQVMLVRKQCAVLLGIDSSDRTVVALKGLCASFVEYVDPQRSGQQP